MACCLDAVAGAVRESTRLAREPRPRRDGVRSTQVSPQKGQMLSLKPPPSGDRTGAPARVVYGEDCYIIPRGDRVVIGADSA